MNIQINAVINLHGRCLCHLRSCVCQRTLEYVTIIAISLSQTNNNVSTISLTYFEVRHGDMPNVVYEKQIDSPPGVLFM